MGTILLTTIITCSQLNSLKQKIQLTPLLLPEQKSAILDEIKKAAPSCPLIVKR